MKIKTLLSLVIAGGLLLLSTLAVSAPPPPPPGTITPEQKVAIENIIQEYIINNPEILVKASKVLQKRQQQAQQQQAQDAIGKNAKELFSDATSPVVGNVNGKITLVEFFDYQCVHCKRMSPTIEQLIKDNGELKVIFKEFPIFGEKSQFASKAALASYKQGRDKYMAFHNALMENKKPLNNESVLAAAKSVGLDLKQLKTDMASKAVTQELENNMKLAVKMGVRFTPAFVIAASPLNATSQPVFVPGAAGKDELQKIIDKVAGK